MFQMLSDDVSADPAIYRVFHVSLLNSYAQQLVFGWSEEGHLSYSDESVYWHVPLTHAIKICFVAFLGLSFWKFHSLIACFSFLSAPNISFFKEMNRIFSSEFADFRRLQDVLVLKIHSFVEFTGKPTFLAMFWKILPLYRKVNCEDWIHQWVNPFLHWQSWTINFHSYLELLSRFFVLCI